MPPSPRGGSKRGERGVFGWKKENAENGRIAEEAKQIPPGYALSRFENRTLPGSDVSTQETDEALAGTLHKQESDADIERAAAERIAKAGVKGVVDQLMRAERMTNEDIAAGRECLRLLKANGDLIRHAMLASKLGAESTRAGKELRAYSLFQKRSAASAAADTLRMAENYNRRKGRYADGKQDADMQAQLSLGETPYQPFMEAQVSRSTSDPVMQKLAGDVAARSGLTLYWADMPEGVRAFFDREKGVIVMNQRIGSAQGAYVAAIHEYTHYMENQPGYDAYASAILKAAYGEDEAAMKLDEGVIRDEYAQSGRKLTDDLLRRELVAAATEQALLGDEAFMRTLFTGGNGSAAVRMLAGMDAFLRKRGAKKQGKQAVERYRLIEAARAQMREAVSRSGKWRAEESEEAEFSIERDAHGRPFVAVKEDILEGVEQSEWPKAVKQALKEKFPNGVAVGNNQIQITKKSRKEITNAKDAMWLKSNQPDIYADKMRAANNADEILQASTDYVSEGLMHERKDDIIDFGRGNVQIEVGGQMYDAEVIVGTKSDGSMLLYDFVKMAKVKGTKNKGTK
ncbi:MAG: hypothetical protein Q4G52_12485, partial [Clostridia bacterium]|nr:hypothetical protein [Clostridia bacterium]